MANHKLNLVSPLGESKISPPVENKDGGHDEADDCQTCNLSINCTTSLND